jgi:hypothetical protein
MVSIGYPPAGFRSLTEAAAANIDSSIKVVVLDSYLSTQPQLGPVRYREISGAPSLYSSSNRAAFQSNNGRWFQLDYRDGIKITDFGGIVLGDTADTAAGNGNLTTNNTALADAHAFAQAVEPGHYIPLTFPIGRFRCSASTAPVAGMTWLGVGRFNASDVQNSSSIYNGTTDILTQLSGDIRDCYFAGLLFDGANLSNDFFTTNIPTDTSTDLRWSKFLYCGFKNFNRVFYGTCTGVYIDHCNINDSNIAIYMKGSDNWILNNLIGSNNGTGTEVVVTLDTFVLGHVHDNFITGEPNIPMQLIGDQGATLITNNNFDIADYSGLFITGAHGATIANNTFNKTGQANDTPHATYDAEIRIHNSYNLDIRGNTFAHTDTGDPPPLAFMTTYKVTSSTAGASHDIYIDDAIFEDGKTRTFSVDANSYHPRFGGLLPLPAKSMGNVETSFKPGEAETVLAATTLTADRILILTTAGAKTGDRVRVTRSAGGAFNLIVRNATAGGTVLATMPTSRWSDFQYSGSAWYCEAFGNLS